MKRRRMPEQSRAWVVVVQYSHGYEADIAIACLTAARILATKRGDGQVGLLALGYDRRTTGGVEVLVPSDELRAAREALGLSETAG